MELEHYCLSKDDEQVTTNPVTYSAPPSGGPSWVTALVSHVNGGESAIDYQ